MVKKGFLQKLLKFKDGDREGVEMFMKNLGVDTDQKDFQESLDIVFGETKTEQAQKKMIDEEVEGAISALNNL